MEGANNELNVIMEDAQLFARFSHGGNWAIALLVARNVQSGGSIRSTRQQGVGSAVAEMADNAVTYRTVINWLQRWNRAAEAGVVPKSSTLEPGDEIELPSEDQHDWHSFKSPRADAERMRMPSDRELSEMFAAERDAGASIKFDIGLPDGFEEDMFEEVDLPHTKAGVSLKRFNQLLNPGNEMIAQLEVANQALTHVLQTMREYDVIAALGDLKVIDLSMRICRQMEDITRALRQQDRIDSGAVAAEEPELA